VAWREPDFCAVGGDPEGVAKTADNPTRGDDSQEQTKRQDKKAGIGGLPQHALQRRHEHLLRHVDLHGVAAVWRPGERDDGRYILQGAHAGRRQAGLGAEHRLQKVGARAHANRLPIPEGAGNGGTLSILYRRKRARRQPGIGNNGKEAFPRDGDPDGANELAVPIGIRPRSKNRHPDTHQRQVSG
jgi:hypothetical protein